MLLEQSCKHVIFRSAPTYLLFNNDNKSLADYSYNTDKQSN